MKNKFIWSEFTESEQRFDQITGEKITRSSTWIIEDGNTRIPICLMHGSSFLEEEKIKQRINLITAAPEMYELLSQISMTSEDHRVNLIEYLSDWTDRINSVLRKARGNHE